MVLSPKKTTKNSVKPHKIIGFDVETYGNYNKFYMGSVYDDDGYKVFYNKEEMKKYILSKKVYRYKSFLVATNLMFDFFALFDYDELEGFNFIFRGSELISVTKIIELKQRRRIRFIDTFNFATKLSVKNLAKIIGLKKLDTPTFIGKRPTNKHYIIIDGVRYTQKEYLELYNIKDSEITYKFSKFFENSLLEMGAELKPTISAIAINYFRLKYLKESYRTPTHKENQIVFKGYYGGRTEAFKRGKIKSLNYYDFNSLYPSVMRKPLPNPNTLISVGQSNIFYINRYEGVTKVRIRTPKYLDIPLLPLRTKHKLIFPLGEFIGSYTHVELREALRLGYKILDIYDGVYFTETIKIFDDFVTDNYNKRMKFKSVGNPIEYVYKIILNSLYGKFAQRYEEKQNIFFINDFDFSKKNLEKYIEVEVLKEFFVITKQTSIKPPAFIQPIWSAYVTAYGRLLMYDTFTKIGFDKTYYCDTDSIFSDTKLNEGEELGDLKLEYFIKDGIIVKPKFYEINGKVKAKGLKGFDKKQNLLDLLKDNSYKSFKFMKLKESLRRVDDYKVNQKVEIVKRIDFEDNKRVWTKKFSIHSLQHSKPLNVVYINGENVVL